MNAQNRPTPLATASSFTKHRSIHSFAVYKFLSDEQFQALHNGAPMLLTLHPKPLPITLLQLSEQRPVHLLLIQHFAQCLFILFVFCVESEHPITNLIGLPFRPFVRRRIALTLTVTLRFDLLALTHSLHRLRLRLLPLLIAVDIPRRSSRRI